MVRSGDNTGLVGKLQCLHLKGVGDLSKINNDVKQ